MIRFAIFAFSVGFVGCSQQPAEPPAPAAMTENVRVVDPSTESPAPAKPDAAQTPVAVVAQSPKTPEPSPAESAYPADLGGKVVAKAVAPDLPALTPAERFGTKPKPRTLPRKFLDPEPPLKAKYALPPVAPGKATAVQPLPPRERVPADFGRGAEAVPSPPTFPVAAGITERARDVKLPPPLPTLGRPLTERVSLDDPTSEFGNAAIVTPAVKATLALAPFLRVSLPDPFELGDQVKPKVAPKDDPGLVPVVVNPQRVK